MSLLKDPCDLLRTLYAAAVARAQPAQVLGAHLPPPPRGRTVVVGAGKAAADVAKRAGLSAHILSDAIEGESQEANVNDFRALLIL